MAKSTTFTAFAKRMAVVADRIGVNTSKELQVAALAGDQVGVIRTPVDTGRARSNWTVSIGEPELVDKPGPNTGSKATNEGAATAQALAQAFNALRGYDVKFGPIFITNSVPYIIPLDEGSSPQATAGMTAFIMQAIRDRLRRAKLLNGV